jgi:hypothetical protein
MIALPQMWPNLRGSVPGRPTRLGDGRFAPGEQLGDRAIAQQPPRSEGDRPVPPLEVSDQVAGPTQVAQVAAMGLTGRNSVPHSVTGLS